MKLTDKHVSDGFIMRVIDVLSNCEHDQKRNVFDHDILNMALELKQRRAEDRQREADACSE